MDGGSKMPPFGRIGILIRPNEVKAVLLRGGKD
jgi:hypothetical protein